MARRQVSVTFDWLLVSPGAAAAIRCADRRPPVRINPGTETSAHRR